MKKIRLTSNWKCISDDNILVKTYENNFITNNNFNKNYTFTDKNDFDYLVILNSCRDKSLEHYINKEKTIVYYLEPSWHPYIYGNIINNLNIAKYVCYHDCNLLNIENNKSNIFTNISGFIPHWVTDFKKNINLDYFLNTNFSKIKKCSFIVSSKWISNKGLASRAKESIYLKRLSLVKAILQSNLDIDIYGKGLIDIFGYHKKIKGEIEHKLDALKDYQFSIAIENTPEDGYFTEKLTDCILTDTTPIYIGCPNIEDYFNNIHKISFKNAIPQIDQILNKNLILDQTENKKLFEYKYNFYTQIINLIENYNI